MNKYLILSAVMLFTGANSAGANSPWIPVEGDLEVTASFQYETFDEFYRARMLTPLPFERLEQATTRLSVDYGVWENFALDLQLGFTGTFSDTIAGVSGMDDTYIGLRWRIVDELDSDSRWTPTVTLRVAGIIAGSYDEGTFPVAPGDGGSGGEFQLAVGKMWGRGFATSLLGGYRVRNNKVPSDWRLQFTASKTFLDWLTVSAGFQQQTSVNGIDLDDPDFGPGRAPELREISTNFEAGLGADDKRGLHYNLFYAYTLDGRNVGKKHILSFAITVPFQIRP